MNFHVKPIEILHVPFYGFTNYSSGVAALGDGNCNAL